MAIRNKTIGSATSPAPTHAHPHREGKPATRTLPPIPKAMYAILQQAHAPISAYDLIALLQQNLERTVHPPTVYRALSLLTEQGLVHRLETQNAYLACSTPGERHDSILFLCRQCGHAEEADDPRVDSLLSEVAHHRAFTPEQKTIEIRGICGRCKGEREGSATGL